MRFIFPTIIFIGFIACQGNNKSLDDAYLMELASWKKERIEKIKKPMGYLDMVGLYWLEEGENTFGSSTTNDIIMPANLPNAIGTFIKNSDTVRVAIDHAEVTINSQRLREAKLIPDTEPNYSMMNWQSNFWYLIKRGDRYGIRIKDTLADSRISTTSLPYFEPSQKWIIKADFIPPIAEESTAIKNHVGITYQSKIKGRLQFNHNSKGYELVGTDGGEGKIFIVFGDDTNGEQTYGGGRFLYVDVPENGEQAILDFNKATNPICALNDFGTCPYPPTQNIMDFPITAGEKKVR